LRINLAEPGLRILINGGEGNGGGKPGQAGQGAGSKGTIPSTWVSGFVRRNGLLAGINANPFDPVSGKEGEPRTIVGLVVSGGILISPPNPRFDALVFYSAGGAAILSQGELPDLGAIQNAVGGFHRILRENQLAERIRPPDRDSPAKTPAMPRHPRSAAGISAEGDYLFLLVIDGRQLASIGATEAETGIILRQLGASEGINFDGGGSAALALRYGDGKVRPVNTPIHGGIPRRERGVAACLGIGAIPGEE
jgi:hypothetical protein